MKEQSRQNDVNLRRYTRPVHQWLGNAKRAFVFFFFLQTVDEFFSNEVQAVVSSRPEVPILVSQLRKNKKNSVVSPGGVYWLEERERK